MTKTLTVLLAAAVHFNGAKVEAGELIELPENSALALIKEGNASEAEKGTSETSKENGEQEPGTDPNEAETAAYELNKRALDDKYKGKIPELKDHAKEVEVEFAHDVTKEKLIEAILEAGKAEAVLAK